jgi:UDP-glucose 4-epimerase
MSVLVTGGTGFLGRYVVDRLGDGEERVVTYDRPLDLSSLATTIAEHDVRGIVHAAGVADGELSVGMPATTVTTNAIGTLNLLEAARFAGFGGRIVLLSSMSVYGDGGSLRPRTPFAATKAFGDLLGQVYAGCYGLDVVSLRLSEVYGPGRRLPRLLEDIIDAASAGQALRVDPGADHPARLLHAEDAARAIVAAVHAPAPTRRVYDIVGEPVHPEQVLAIVRDRTPDAAISIEPLRAPDAEPVEPLSITAADRELGYRPRWGLARGIDDFWTWREAEGAC